MEKLKIILDLLNLLLWTSIVGSVILFFKPIKGILETTHEIIKQRGFKVSTSGVEIPSPQETVDVTQDTSTQHSHLEELFKRQNQANLLALTLIGQNHDFSAEPPQSAYTHEIINSLRLFLEEKTRLDATLSKESILLTLICKAYVNLYFERCFQYLFGSQLHLLSHLLYQPHNQTSKEKIAGLFDAASHDTSVISFDKWLRSLETMKFIHIREETIEITEEGKEFMHYIADKGYSIKKLG